MSRSRQSRGFENPGADPPRARAGPRFRPAPRALRSFRSVGIRPGHPCGLRALHNLLAGLILEGKIGEGGTARVSAGKDGLVINGIKAEAA